MRDLFLPLLALLPLAGATAADPITARTDEVGRLLNEWAAARSAAGLAAITYENRDDKHSMLPLRLWPGLQTHVFSKEDEAAGRAKGPAGLIRKQPVIGNCSMAAPADRGGSLARFYFMKPEGNRFLAAQYLANQLFIYPEHQDHDPGGNGVGGWGDLFPLNSPAVLISQGSSGSDQPFLQAVLSAIAALPPDTQRRLIERRLLSPVVQFLLRRHNRVVASDEDYLTGKAHPVVFSSAMLDEKKMVLAANAMLPGAVPPLAAIEVVEETQLEAGVHFFETEKTAAHRLADTPVSIARVFRGNQAEYELVISAARSQDLLGRPLKLRVAVLQGDPALVRIEPQPNQALTRVAVRWQPPALTTPAGSATRSHRVDIGFFADNGVSLSPPAILSLYMLPNERRFYDEQGRVAEIHYAARNPDPGLPAADNDTRWLRVLAACVRPPEGLRATLMERAFEESERAALTEALQRLESLQQRLAELEKDKERRKEADEARRALETALRQSLAAKLPGTRALSVRQTLATAFDAIARFTDLYPGFQREIDDLAARSPVKNTAAALRAEVAHLTALGILLPEADGRISALRDADTRSEAENDALKSLNLTVLSHALFPDALQRAAGPAWVDPRLTTVKAWRDVYRYDPESGRLTGWLRHHNGRTTWFDARGRWLPDGPGPNARALPVTYVPDPATGLRAVASEG